MVFELYDIESKKDIILKNISFLDSISYNSNTIYYII